MSDVFSPYQIDYSVKNTSKTFGFSKKKVTFKFGVANPPAVEAGANGADCRGSEHEIIFTWSLNSGKRQILSDGKDVHYSETGQNGWTADQVFQHHFNIRVPGLSGPLRAHLITQPTNRDVPHIKPFDLRINGLSYFSMPKIFQLGTQQMITRAVKGKGRNRGGGGGRDSNPSPAERQAIAAAKLASMQDLERAQNQQHSHSITGYASAPPPVDNATEDLLSFGAPPAPVGPPPPQGAYGQPAQSQTYSNYSLGTSMTGSVQSSPLPYPSQGPFASQQPQPQPPQQQQNLMGGSFNYGQPTQPPMHQQQMPLYGQTAPAPLPPAQPPQQQPFYGQQQPPPPVQTYGQQQQQQNPLTSPSNQTQMSYQSYGSAPSFAQPPQQQPPPSQQQAQQPYYGQIPQTQGYP